MWFLVSIVDIPCLFFKAKEAKGCCMSLTPLYYNLVAFDSYSSDLSRLVV